MKAMVKFYKHFIASHGFSFFPEGNLLVQAKNLACWWNQWGKGGGVYNLHVINSEKCSRVTENVFAKKRWCKATYHLYW